MRRILASVCTLLTLVDAAETWSFLHAGTGREMNPPVRWLMGAIGVFAALAIFSAVRIAVVWWLAEGSRYPGLRTGVLVFITACWTFAVVWNVTV